MTAALELQGLYASYGAVKVLDDVSLEVAAGGITALLGANGAGKTTVLRAISNAIVSRSGSIRFQGERIDHLSTDRIARLGIAHVPDGRGTFAPLTVEENLRIGAIGRGTTSLVGEDIDHIYALFPKLFELRRRPGGLLSGGEQQMLAIGRALMLRPRLLLLDEPSFGLAALIVRQIFDMLGKVNAQGGPAILLVEQNAGLALDLADQAYVLEVGRITLAGPAEQLRGDARVRAAYLGA